MADLVEHVLVYLDGSEESLTASEYAILLAEATNATLSAVYVINTRALQDLVRSRIFLEAEEQEYSRDLEADADRYLNHVKKVADRRGITVALFKRRGSVQQELTKIIDDEEIDLLVLGELAHVRSRRDEFYDEAERAMRSSACSVLIVKDSERVASLFENEE
jgi:nucleotide-binding universal stress UspA family protein